MTNRIRLIVLSMSELDLVGFGVTWAAPTDEIETPCESARLETGDGETLDLGLLCAPTSATWRSQRVASLTGHRYADAGPFTARLVWGDETAEVSVLPGLLPAAGEPPRPDVALFAVKTPPHQPFQRAVSVKLIGLAPDQQARLDGGAGQAYILAGRDGADPERGWTLDYPKAGAYTITLDLLDADGFWLATLAETPIIIAVPEPAPLPAAVEPAPTPALAGRPTLAARPADVSTAAAETQPWLPYRYCHPTGWTSARLYRTPGGGEITRVVGAGVYLSIRG